MLANQPQTEERMNTTPEQNKRLVLEAFDALFNKRDYLERPLLCWVPANRHRPRLLLGLSRLNCLSAMRVPLAARA